MVEKIIEQMKKHLEDPEWLSKAAIFLAGELYHQNSKMAEAELREREAAILHLIEGAKQGLKRSIAESEAYGVIETGNTYGILKAQGEAIIEMINSIKKRLDVLSWEFHKSN